MHTLVFCKLYSVTASIITELALMDFLFESLTVAPCVSSLMNHHMRMSAKVFVTKITFVGLFTCVHVLVPHECLDVNANVIATRAGVCVVNLLVVNLFHVSEIIVPTCSFIIAQFAG